MKRHATTIVLVLLVAITAIYIYATRDRVTDGERSRREGSVFPAWRRDELTRIEIQRNDETLVLERDAKKDSAWRMTKPRVDKADQAAIERLLTTLEFAVVVRKATDQFGEPRARVTIGMERLTLHFSLGGPSPRPEGSSYAFMESGPTVVVSKELADTLLASSDVYRDRTIVPYLSTDLSRFEVKQPNGGFALDRIDDRSFRVASEGVLLARVGADKVWGALAEVRAESFPPDADADRLVANPRLTIVMTPKDGRPPAELFVGDPCPNAPDSVTVVRRQPTRSTACAPKGILEAFLSPPASLVEHQVFTLHHDEIEELRLELLADPGSSIELARKGTGFHMRAPKDHDLDADEADAASALIDRIEWSKAELVTRGTGDFTPIARAKVRRGEREEIIDIGPFVADARVILRRQIDGARLEVTPGVARRFLPRKTTLKPRTLLGDARRVTKVNLRCGTLQDFVDAGQGLRLVEPKGYETDSGITSLVDTLVRGKVDAWIADDADASFGIEKGDCKVTLVFEDGKDPRTILLGADGETGVFGRIEGRPEVFVAPKSLKELASAIYVSRGALRIQGDAKITFTGKPPFDAQLDGFIAERVEKLGKPIISPVAITLEARGEAGSTKILCSQPATTGARSCAREGVNATFEVSGNRFEKLQKIASDAGAR